MWNKVLKIWATEKTYEANNKQTPPGVRLGVAKAVVDLCDVATEPGGVHLSPGHKLGTARAGCHIQNTQVLKVNVHIT